MGLFSFLKKAGASLMGRDEKPVTSESPEPAAPAIPDDQKEVLLKGIITSHGLKIENLSLDVNDDAVTVYGQVKSQDEREKIVMALGNVSGVATVDDRISVDAPSATFYTVKKGDSLSKIAKAHYGDAMKYPVIFEANKPMLSDPDKIYPGQSLRIPNLSA